MQGILLFERAAPVSYSPSPVHQTLLHDSGTLFSALPRSSFCVPPLPRSLVSDSHSFSGPLFSVSTSLEHSCALLPVHLCRQMLAWDYSFPFSPVLSTFLCLHPQLTVHHSHHVLHLLSMKILLTKLGGGGAHL